MHAIAKEIRTSRSTIETLLRTDEFENFRPRLVENAGRIRLRNDETFSRVIVLSLRACIVLTRRGLRGKQRHEQHTQTRAFALRGSSYAPRVLPSVRNHDASRVRQL